MKMIAFVLEITPQQRSFLASGIPSKIKFRPRSKAKPIRCTSCSFTARTITEMSIHTKTHGSSGQFFQGNHFTAKVDFLRHMFTRTEVTTHRCCLCPTEFASRQALLKHLNTHASGETGKTFRCPQCHAEPTPDQNGRWLEPSRSLS
ncbi:hypothetical protein ISCGN_024253 [Ixodes scapularis]